MFGLAKCKLQSVLISIYLWLAASSFTTSTNTSYTVTRLQNDKFNNPTASEPCDWTNPKFCNDRKANCDGNCCRCLCEYDVSTFNAKTEACQNNSDFRKGCDLLFKDVYKDQPLKLLDLGKDGDAQVVWRKAKNKQKFQQCDIKKIMEHGTSTTFSEDILVVDGITRKHDTRLIKIKWDDDNIDLGLYGKLFKVDMSCKIHERRTGRPKTEDRSTITKCFVFKAAGNLTSHPPQPTTMAKTQQPSDTQTTTDTDDHSEVITDVFTDDDQSSTTESGGSPDTDDGNKDKRHGKHDDDDDGGSNAGVIASVVAITLALVVAVVIYVLWRRRKNGNTLSNKPQARHGIPNHGANVSIPMNSMENIYAEANVKTPEKVGEDNGVYTYADARYATLTKPKPQDSNFYQPLNTAGKNLYESIPAQKLASGQAPVSEPVYNVFDGDTNPPDDIYHELEDQHGNDTPIRQVTGRSEQTPEQVYSVLENDNDEYLTVLPEASPSYECPSGNV